METQYNGFIGTIHVLHRREKNVIFPFFLRPI